MNAPSDVLQSPPPKVSAEQAAALLAREYLIRADQLTPLASERDTNFKVESPQGRFVLKFANRGEDAQVTRLQTAALLHIARVAPELPVQRVVPTFAGHSETYHEGSMVRLLTWLDGLPQHAAPRAPSQGASIGAGLASLGLALSTLEFNGGEQDLQWDIAHALRLREKLDAVDAQWRPAVADALNRFELHVTPRLARLRRQFVHNDLNPFNVLMSPENPDELAGILDFGDMVRTPLICDVGVAAAYQLLPGLDPIECLTPFLAGYTRVRPLLAEEIEILPELILARASTTIVITSWRARAYPENRDYILRNAPSAMAGLEALARIPRDHIIAAFKEVTP